MISHWSKRKGEQKRGLWKGKQADERAYHLFLFYYSPNAGICVTIVHLVTLVFFASTFWVFPPRMPLALVRLGGLMERKSILEIESREGIFGRRWSAMTRSHQATGVFLSKCS